MTKASVAVGPWGGNGGTRWDDGANFDGIRKITVFSGTCVDSISVVYDKNGVAIAEGKHGGNGGGAAEYDLQFPEEYIVGASGHYGPVSFVPTPVVRSLTLRTNKRTLGPFGREGGTPFSLPIEGGRIVSFTGRSDIVLDAIGFRIASDCVDTSARKTK